MQRCILILCAHHLLGSPVLDLPLDLVSFQLPPSVSPLRSYATSVAFIGYGKTSSPPDMEALRHLLNPGPLNILTTPSSLHQYRKILFVPSYHSTYPTMSAPCGCPPPVLHIASGPLSNPWLIQRPKSLSAPPIALSMLYDQELTIKVSGPQPDVIKKPEIVPALDGTMNSSTPSPSPFLLQPNTQRRNKIRHFFMLKMGRLLRSL